VHTLEAFEDDSVFQSLAGAHPGPQQRAFMYIHWSGNGASAMSVFAVLLMLAGLRLRLRRRSRQNQPHQRKARFRIAGAAIGNALQAVHVFVDPGVRYVISERLEEAAEDDGHDDPADPARHLEGQLRRIRRGEEIDRLTIRMKEKE
jgi:hypothetical protein